MKLGDELVALDAYQRGLRAGRLFREFIERGMSMQRAIDEALAASPPPPPPSEPRAPNV